jgi:hypothetical protein
VSAAASDPGASGEGQPGGQVTEFKAMADALHAAGIEVLLDVVFNHTAEGDHTTPTLCFRALDSAAYYRLDPGDPRRYLDTTGCGNSLNAGDPLTLQLRWAGTEMTDVTWSDPNALATALYLDGCDAPDRAADRPVRAVSSEPHRAASECDWIAALRSAWYVRDTGVRCNALAYVRAIRNPSRGELI